MTDLLSETPVEGTLAYNGFVFGPPLTTPAQWKVDSDVRYDDSGRAVVGIDYVLEVSALVTGETAGDLASQVESIRQTLSRPGGVLLIENLGWNSLHVPQDTAYGPRPLGVELIPIASGGCWQLRWKVAFTLTEGATTTAGDWLALSFATTYEIDAAGFTTRTVAGQAHIVGRRDDEESGAIGATADAVRDNVVIAIPQGFRRERSRWTEDPSKTRLEFEVVDRELDHLPYPAGIVAGQVDLTVRQETWPQNQALATLEGWLEHAVDQPHHHSAERLLLMAADRAARLTTAAGGLLLPTRLEIRQGMFQRKAWLNCQWRRLGCLWQVLATSGIWEPLEGTDYATWRPSVEGLWGNRGTAELASRIEDGVIVDLVDRPTSELEIGATGGSATSPGGSWQLPALLPTVTEATSWLEYQARLTVHRQEQTTRHYVAQSVTYGPGSDGVGQEFSATHPPLWEVHGQPHLEVAFEGHAERVAYLPAVPQLVSVGGQALVERSRRESREQVTTWCGQPVYRTEWKIVYDVAGYIAAHTPPAIPAELAQLDPQEP